MQEPIKQNHYTSIFTKASCIRGDSYKKDDTSKGVYISGGEFGQVIGPDGRPCASFFPFKRPEESRFLTIEFQAFKVVLLFCPCPNCMPHSHACL